MTSHNGAKKHEILQVKDIEFLSGFIQHVEPDLP